MHLANCFQRALNVVLACFLCLTSLAPGFAASTVHFSPKNGLSYHNPNTGRFWTQDSYEGNGSDPASLHKYTYCGNNPVGCYDPSGHESLGEVMMGSAIGNMLGGALINSYVGALSRFTGSLFGGGGLSGSSDAALGGLDEDVESGMIGGLTGYGLGKAAFWAVGKFTPYLLGAGPIKALVAYAKESTLLNNAYASAKQTWSALDAAVIQGSEAAINIARNAQAEAVQSILKFSGRVYQLGTELGFDSGGRIFDDLAAFATGNQSAAEVVLGQFDSGGASSYINIAKSRAATYFSLGDYWDNLGTVIGKENLWLVNKAFLRQQVESGKSIILSHDPNLAPAGTGFSKEIGYLQDLGYQFIRDGNIWRAVR